MVLLFFYFFLALNIYSKDIMFIDSETELPISSVSVFIKDTDNKNFLNKNIISNIDGIIDINEKYNYTLIISHVSFDSLTIRLEANKIKDRIYLNPKTFYIKEIVTTGQIRPTTTQKSIFKVNVIDEESIDARAAPTLREVLINETNLKVGKDGILGSNLSINGIGGENVKIMVDGVPVIGRENGNINLDQINVKNAERIEIIQGPMSAIYGSDALGGVINIISKNPEHNFYLNLESYNESVGSYNLSLNSNFNYKDNVFLISSNRNLFQGFSPTNTFRAHTWDPRIQYFSDFKWIRKFDNYNVSYNFNYMYDFILNRSEPIDVPYNELAFDDEYYTNRYMNTINISGVVDEDRYINVIANHSLYYRKTERYLKDLVSLDRTLTQDLNDQKFNNFQSFMSRGTYSHDKILSSYSYQMGYEVRYDDGEGDRINNNNTSILDAALFFTSEYKPIEKFIINPMFRFIYNSKYDAPIIPVLNLKYDINKNSNVRASYAAGFRSPTIKELNLEFIDQNHYIIGNPNLEAENSYTLNLSYDYNLMKADYVLKTDARLFYNNIFNQISLINVDFEEFLQQQIFSYSNINEFTSAGMQLNLSFFRERFTSNLSFTYFYFWTSLSEEYSSTPELSYNVNYYFENIDLRIALFYKYTGQVVNFNYNGSNDGEDISEEDVEISRINSYSNLDINLSKYLLDKDIEISLGIKNLFDVTNIATTGLQSGGVHTGNNSSIPINWGRTYFLRLNYSLN